MRIVILGPVSPSALTTHFQEGDQPQANRDDGAHGPSIGALANSLLAMGHEVVVITHRRGYGSLTMSGPHLEFYRVPSRASARAQILDGFRQERRAMAEVLRSVVGDVVHAHWTYEWALVAMESALPKVVTVHDAPLSVLRKNRSLYWFLRYLMALRFRAGAGGVSVLAVSPYVGERWAKEVGYKKLPIVIPNTVEILDAPASGEYVNSAQFIEIANASKLKNVKGLLNAFSLVKQLRSEATLVLAGTGLDEDGLIADWARSSNLATGVVFLGPQPQSEIRLLLQRSTAHVHASLEESFGLTLIEAMSMRRPVIAGSNSGATSWVLDEGMSGVLADMNNPKSIASAMLRVLDDANLRNRVAESAYERYERLFSPRAVAEAHVAHYERILGAVEDGAVGR